MFWAVHKLGGAISPANPAYGPSELSYQLKDSGSIALVTSSKLLHTALKAIDGVPAISKNRIYLIDGENHATQKTVEQLIQAGRKILDPLRPLKLHKGEARQRLAFVSYSSGTTGLPKGVMISHYNVMSNVLQLALHGKEFDDKKRDMTACLLPLYHIYGISSNHLHALSYVVGLVYVLHTELYLGNTCVIIPAFEFSSFLSYIEKYRITKLFLVPPIVVRLVKDPLTQKYDLSTLEQITCGAAPLGADVMQALRAKFRGIIFKQGMNRFSSTISRSLRDD